MAKSARKYGKRSGKKNGGEYTKDVIMGNNGLDWNKSFTIRRFLRMPNLKTAILGSSGEKVLQIYMLHHEVKENTEKKTGTLKFTFKNCDFDAAALLVNKIRSLFYDIGIDLGSNYISKGTVGFTGGWSTENIIVMNYEGEGLTKVTITTSKDGKIMTYEGENTNLDLFNKGFETIKKDFSEKTELAVSSFETNAEGLLSGVANVGEGNGQSNTMFRWSKKPTVPSTQESTNNVPPGEEKKPQGFFSRFGFGGRKTRSGKRSKKGSRKARR